MRFIDFLTKDRLLSIYKDKVVYSGTKGIDKINSYEFGKNLDRNLNKIIRDISNNNYKFKPYKVILIPKKVDSAPRKVCVPTISDRLVIESIKEYIYLCYESYSLNFSISKLIKDFITDYNSKNYSSYIKADLTTYFDTINHKKLIKKLRKTVDDELVLKLLIEILKNGQKYGDTTFENSKGIPQGLSISMLLANIYMIDVDAHFKNKKDVHYYRYVDDIFIFCKKHVRLNYFKLKYLLFNNRLRLNKNKTRISRIEHPFVFLGYSITKDHITVKEQSILKIETAIEKLFKQYKYNNNKDELLWRLNIRISGAICNNKKYGWLFYFSDIDYLQLLYHLDNLVEKLKKRYNVPDIKNKKFVKTYYEIQKKNIKDNKYFFNIDKVDDNQKKQILKNITKIDANMIDELSAKDLDYNYRKAVFKCLKALELDLDSIS